MGVSAMLNIFRPVSLVRPVINFAGSSFIQPLYSHRTFETLKAPSKFEHGESIRLTIMVPSSKEPQILRCQTTDQLSRFVEVYKGALAVLGVDGTEIIPPSKYSEVSPSTIYEIISPFFASMKDERQHPQAADKAFEDKSRQALTRYIKEQQFSFHELGRTIKVDGSLIAEWEGVYELEGGGIWFLECKHCVSTDVVLQQPYRLKKSMNALGKPVSSGRVFIAGEFWRPTDGRDPKLEAQEQGFGILYENGVDLAVVYVGGSQDGQRPLHF